MRSRIRRWLHDFAHNCLVHPLLPFVPTRWGDALHDRHADWAFGRDRVDELSVERAMRDTSFASPEDGGRWWVYVGDADGDPTEES